MRVGRAATSILIRGLIFLVVLAALAPHRTSKEELRDSSMVAMHEAAAPSSFKRALIGFVASLTVTVMLMVVIGVPAATGPDTTGVGLRGSIFAE